MKRTHRQRTQTYMKTLEKEVLRLRNAETDSMAKIEKLQRQVDLLLTTLVEHKIPIPPEVIDEALLHSTLPPGVPRGVGRVVLNPQDQSSLVSLDYNSGSAGISSSSSLIEEARIRSAAVEPLIPTGDEESPPPSTAPRVTAFDERTKPSILHDPQVGIEFVLAYAFPASLFISSAENNIASNDHAFRIFETATSITSSRAKKEVLTLT